MNHQPSVVVTKSALMINLIRDKVAEDDFFGGHSKVANALVSIIRSTSAVRLIALLGPWGSGKSTVLRFVEDKLHKNIDDGVQNFVFVYDAWLHQSDPPRRSFIESLIIFLDNKKLLDAKDWTVELDALSRRSETHDIQKTPTLTWSGTVLALSLFGLPIGYRLLDQYWYDSPIPFTCGVISFGFVAWMLFFLPCALAGSIYLWWRPNRNPFKKSFWVKDNWNKNRRPHEDQNVLSVVVNKTIDKVTNRIIKTPDPTAIEFRETYDKIVQAISSKQRRFVFVIDNLDRVPADEAVRIWSTIRNFFLDRSDELTGKTDQKNFQPWVILPLDPGAIEAIYSNAGEGPLARQRAQAFVEKTFDAVLYVGPPVTSDWQDYLRARLVEVFGDLATNSRIYEATKVFETAIAHGHGNESITPRRINAFVNKLAGMWLIWEDAIPFPSLTYYSLHAEQVMSEVQVILGSEAPGGVVMRRLDPSWQTHVAAVHFGVDAPKAAQLLLQPEIEQSIVAGDTKRFKELQSVPGFEVVLEQVVEQKAQDEMEPAFVLSCAALLTSGSLASARISTVWSLLVSGTNKMLPWEKPFALAEPGLKAILAHESKTTLSNLVGSLTSVSEKFVSEEEGHWLAYLRACFDLSKNQEGFGAALTEIRVPGDAHFYCEVIMGAADADFPVKYPALAKSLRPTPAAKEAVPFFASRTTDLRFDQKMIAAMHLLRKVHIQWHWEQFISAAENFVRNNRDDPGIAGAIEVLIALDASDTLETLGAQGVLADLYYAALQRDDRSSEGALLLASAIGFPELNIQNQQNQVVTGLRELQNLSTTLQDRLDDVTRIVSNLAERTINAQALSALVTMAQSHPEWRGLVGGVLRIRIQQESLEKLYLDDAINHLDLWFELAGREAELALVIQLTGYSGFWETLAKQSNDQLFFRVIQICLSNSTAPQEGARAALVKHLASKGADWWKEIISTSAPAMGVVVELLRSSETDLGEEYALGLEHQAENALQNLEYPDEEWPGGALVRGLSASRSEVFLKNLLDRMRGSEPASIAIGLYLYGDELLSSRILLEEADQNTRMLILPVLSSGDPDAIEDILNLDGPLYPMIKASSPASKVEIKKRLKLLEDSDIQEGIRERLKDLRKTWKMVSRHSKTKAPRRPGKKSGQDDTK